MRAIHLTPRGVVTKDQSLAKELVDFLQRNGIECKWDFDGEWHKVYVRRIKGGDMLLLARAFAERYDDVEVWLFMSKVYTPKKQKPI